MQKTHNKLAKALRAKTINELSQSLPPEGRYLMLEGFTRQSPAVIELKYSLFVVEKLISQTSSTVKVFESVLNDIKTLEEQTALSIATNATTTANGVFTFNLEVKTRLFN